MLPYHLSFFVCFVFFSLGTRSDEIITSAFLFMKKHFRYFFLWKIYLFPYFEDVLYLPSPPSPPFWLSKRSSPIYREIGPDWVSLWQDKTFRNRARIVESDYFVGPGLTTIRARLVWDPIRNISDPTTNRTRYGARLNEIVSDVYRFLGYRVPYFPLGPE